MKLVRMGIAAVSVAILSISSQAYAEQPIKIGVLNDQNGMYADTGGFGSVVAARLAVEDFGGNVGGRPVEVVTADQQSKPDIAVAIARRWIETEGVSVIVDGGNTATALATAEVTKKANRLFLVGGAAGSDITGKYCDPLVMHFTYDTYALARGTANALVKRGGKTWYFITADYTFGHALERDASRFVKEAGGSVIGSVRNPLNTPDFASFLLQAQSSKAQVVGIANAGTDTINAIKQAHDFGLTKSGQTLAALLIFLSDVHAMGLEQAQGLIATTSFYWDRNDETREWTKRFLKQSKGKVPTMIHAGVYSSVRHYLSAIKATNSMDAAKISEWMKANPINDMNNKNVEIRPDGRVLHDMYLVQVKTPAESKYPLDYYKILATTPGKEAFRPLSESECGYIKKN